mmetsp:Transcript_2171/g.6107  ORF Transcript_2171/g.6107 Transcript_2171/m.6107 type:complete len:98 (+) Transcript_2171:103-396(+)
MGDVSAKPGSEDNRIVVDVEQPLNTPSFLPNVLRLLALSKRQAPQRTCRCQPLVSKSLASKSAWLTNHVVRDFSALRTQAVISKMLDQCDEPVGAVH